MNRVYTLILIFLLCLLYTQQAAAQGNEAFSYIYIQGDKETPFYVKFENEMLPRYGKNYCIISELAPGPVNVQILFQQNAYPAQKFVIQVPDYGFRAFLLTKKGNEFSLYDIHQRFYLRADNIAADDVLPPASQSKSLPEPVNVPVKNEVAAPQAPAVVTVPPVKKPAEKVKPVEEAPKKVEKVKKEKIIVRSEVPTPVVPPTPPVLLKTESAPSQNSGPKFIDDITLKNDKTTAPAGTINKPGRSRIEVVNSDCPDGISNEAFAELEQKTKERFGDERLKYVLNNMDNCFTTTQIRTLARIMGSDAERYTLLKRAYPRISDQSVFPILEREFSDAEWKEYFRALFKKQN